MAKELIIADRHFFTERYILSTNPVLYLPLWMRDGNPIRSEDGHGYIGTVTGAVWTPRGRTFAGSDDHIACTNNSDFNFTSQNFSVEVWIKPDALADQILICRGLLDTDGWYSISGSNGSLLLVLCKATVSYNIQLGAGTVTAGTWQHYILVRNGTSGAIYKNGVAGTLGGTGFTDNALTSTRILYLGRFDDGLYRFNGIFGEARIYSRALTSVEAQLNYLVTRWRYR